MSIGARFRKTTSSHSTGYDPTSRITDPLDVSRIFSWLICESRDDKGNGIRYLYKKEDGTYQLGDRKERRNFEINVSGVLGCEKALLQRGDALVPKVRRRVCGVIAHRHNLFPAFRQLGARLTEEL